MNTLSPGAQLRQYRIDSVIGQGGFGITYLATDQDLDRKVAIKECYPRDFAQRQGTTVVPTSMQNVNFDWALAKFLEEAATLAKFKHPGIVQVLQIIKDENNTAYMVLEFIDGLSFTQWLKSLGRSPTQSELLNVVDPLLVAMELVHRNDYTHRDIAPDNIYLRENGEPVLLDFGAARSSLGHHSKTLNLVVKEGYSPPEQYYSEGRGGPASDIYSMAATMYRAIAGKRPVEASARSDALVNGTVDPLEPLSTMTVDGYDAAFLAAIDAGLATQVAARPRDVAAWRAMLRGGAGTSERAAGATTVLPTMAADTPRTDAKKRSVEPAKPKRISSTGRSILAGGLIAVFAVAGYAGYSYYEERQAIQLAAEQARLAQERKAASEREAERLRTERIQNEQQKAAAKAQADRVRAEQDRKAWSAAEASGSLLAYRNYLEEYPNGAFATDARTAVTAFSQPWTKTFGGPGNETATSLALVGDDYLVAGSTQTRDLGTQGWLSRINGAGRLLWSSTIGGSGLEAINAVATGDDGNVLAVGYSTSDGSGRSDALLVMVAETGDTVWEKRYGFSGTDRANGVVRLSSGDFVVVGTTDRGGEGGLQGWMFRINAFGDVLWDKTFGGRWDDEFTNVAVLPNSGLAVSGSSMLAALKGGNFWFLKTDENGAVSFERKPGGTSKDILNAVVSRADGAAVFVGETSSFGTGTVDSFISVLSADNVSPPKIFPERSGDDVFNAGAVMADGTIVATGHTTSKGRGGRDGWILRMDERAKETVWERVIGGRENDEIGAVIPLPSGGMLLAGSTQSYGAGGRDVWVLKLDKDGRGAAQ